MDTASDHRDNLNKRNIRGLRLTGAIIQMPTPGISIMDGVFVPTASAYAIEDIKSGSFLLSFREFQYNKILASMRPDIIISVSVPDI